MLQMLSLSSDSVVASKLDFKQYGDNPNVKHFACGGDFYQDLLIWKNFLDKQNVLFYGLLRNTKQGIGFCTVGI